MKDYLKAFRDGHHDFESNEKGLNASNPFELFDAWMEDAVSNEEMEPNAFVISTVSADLQPSNRIVYLKGVIDQQYLFYTNYNSQKGQDIAQNSKVSILFFWPKLHRQVRIEAICTKTSEEISDNYFNSRPRGSQIGAWASEQSDELEDRDTLTKRVDEFEKKFPSEVPRPPHWGGYQLKPTKFEFWQGRPSRLHDRLVFVPSSDQWTITRKNP